MHAAWHDRCGSLRREHGMLPAMRAPAPFCPPSLPPCAAAHTPQELLRHYSPAYQSKLLSALSTEPLPADAIAAAYPAAEPVLLVADAEAPVGGEPSAAAETADGGPCAQLALDAATDVAEQISEGAESLVPVHEELATEELHDSAADAAGAVPAPCEEGQDDSAAEAAGAAPASFEEGQADNTAEAAGAVPVSFEEGQDDNTAQAAGAVPAPLGEGQAAERASAEQTLGPTSALQQEVHPPAQDEEPMPTAGEEAAAAEAAVEATVQEVTAEAAHEAVAEAGEVATAQAAAAETGAAPAAAQHDDTAPASADGGAQAAREQAAELLAGTVLSEPAPEEQGGAEPVPDQCAATELQGDQQAADAESAKPAGADNEAGQEAAAAVACEPSVEKTLEGPAAVAAAVLHVPAQC